MTILDELQEAERLKVLHGYGLLDTPRDGAFDRLTSLAARFFDVPICLVSLVDEDRIWFKSSFGLEATEIPRSPGLCASAMFGEAAYVVRDAIDDPRTLTNPLVLGALGLRFYAAAPLVTHDGHALGTINIIDFHPRELDEAGQVALRDFASLVMEQLELRLSARKAFTSLARAFSESHDLDHLMTVCAWTKKVQLEGEWLTFEEFLVSKLGLTITHGIHPDAAQDFLKD